MNTILENYQIVALVNDLRDVAVKHAGSKHIQDLIAGTVSRHFTKAGGKFRIVGDQAWWEFPCNAKLVAGEKE